MSSGKFKRSLLRKKNSSRLRLNVYKSNSHLYAQIIDDNQGVTKVQVSTLTEKKSLTIENAKQVGLVLAKKAKEQKISIVWFDRGYFKYHGRVKALADGAREGGLKF